MSKITLLFVGLSVAAVLQSMNGQAEHLGFGLRAVKALQDIGQQEGIVEFRSVSLPKDYVIRQTGIGSTAIQEVIFDPQLAEMMREMNSAKAACNARIAQERKAAKKAETTFGSGLAGGAKKMFGGSK